jgi:hypothetical protein
MSRTSFDAEYAEAQRALRKPFINLGVLCASALSALRAVIGL